MKEKTVQVFEEWKEGWSTPDVYVYKGRGKNRERIYLRIHTIGKPPFIKYKPSLVT